MATNLLTYALKAPLAALGLFTLSTQLVVADGLPKVEASASCPASVNSIGAGAVLGCWCPDDAASGSVWGSGPYTADSNLCRAARHSGVVPAGGGAVWLRIAEGQGSYAGSSANGVTTSNYGQFGLSYSFLNAKATTSACPGNMQGVRGLLTCSCSASQAAQRGSVWGTDIYTEDSAVCKAALHAGAIDAKGGNVSIIVVAGQKSYQGTSRNGVDTSSFGSWGASYMFAN